MAISRRGLMGAGAAGAAMWAAGCSSTTAGGSPAASTSAKPASSGPPTGELRFAWWGNDSRNKNTAAMIEAFQKANPGITVKGEPGEWNSYWDKLATQVAGNQAPDVIQMSINYVREYGDRGALMDLNAAKVKVDRFAPGANDSGMVKGKLLAVNAGVNTPVIVANPAVFTAAKIDLPDDKTWTWQTYKELAARITAASPKGTYGSSSFWTTTETMFDAWLRQQGKSIYGESALGFQPSDIVPWFKLMQEYLGSGAIPPQALTSEDAVKPLAQQLTALGRAGMYLYHSNQVAALDAATGQDLKLLRGPSMTGNSKDRKTWYAASMLYSISTKTKYPEAAAAFVNFMSNDVAGNAIQLAERGLPPNLDVRAGLNDKLSKSDQKAAKFLTDIEPELGSIRNIPLVGTSTFPTIYTRWCEEVAFGKATPEVAAQKLYDEVNSGIK